MNCATTNADPLKIRAICVIRIIRDLRRTRPNATCIQTGHKDSVRIIRKKSRAYKALLQERVALCQRLLNPIQATVNLCQRGREREAQVVISTESIARHNTDTCGIEQIIGNIH